MNNTNAFFALIQGGLWEQCVQLQPFDKIDFAEVHKLARTQSVMGSVAAGLEHVEDRKVSKPEALPFLTAVVGLEGRNEKMNHFVASLFERLQEAGIRAVLVKGAGNCTSILILSGKPFPLPSASVTFAAMRAYFLSIPSASCPESSLTAFAPLPVGSRQVALFGE